MENGIKKGNYLRMKRLPKYEMLFFQTPDLLGKNAANRKLLANP